MDRSKPTAAAHRETCVELDLKIELGRARISREDFCRLGAGSVVRLDSLVLDPVDVVVDGRLVARGEVLVLDDKLCVRVTELVTGAAQRANEAA